MIKGKNSFQFDNFALLLSEAGYYLNTYLNYTSTISYFLTIYLETHRLVHGNTMENVPWDGMGQHALHFPWGLWDSSYVRAF